MMATGTQEAKWESVAELGGRLVHTPVHFLTGLLLELIPAP